MSDFNRFRKIDAHTHIGAFGSPFNIDFNVERLLEQMAEYNIQKTILCSSSAYSNEDTAVAYKQHPDLIIPLMWVNCAQGQPTYDLLEHYLRDEHFAGAKLQSLFDGYTADAPCVDPVAELCEKYGKPLFVHSGHPPFSLPWQIGLLAERHPHLPIVMIHMGHAHGVYVDAAITMAKRYDNICNYIDIPLQHINSRILGSMQRGIDRQGTLNLLQMFRDKLPDVSIRTTLIVGYPGETEQDFEELKQFVKEAHFDRMGCFAYSPEEGTPAEKLGDPIPQEEKERRVSELMAIQEAISMEKNQARVGRTFRVLIDRHEGDYYIGRTEYDSPEIDDEVLISSPTPLRIGHFYTVRITQALEHDLMASLI